MKNNVSKFLVWAAIALIIATGLIHLTMAKHEFEEGTYIGFLFILNAVFAVVAAVGIYRHRGWAWVLGALIAGLSIIGYIISRTAGMPGAEVEEWNAIGFVAMIVEGAFIAVYAMTHKKRRP